MAPIRNIDRPSLYKKFFLTLNIIKIQINKTIIFLDNATTVKRHPVEISIGPLQKKFPQKNFL